MIWVAVTITGCNISILVRLFFLKSNQTLLLKSSPNFDLGTHYRCTDIFYLSLMYVVKQICFYIRSNKKFKHVDCVVVPIVNYFCFSFWQRRIYRSSVCYTRINFRLSKVKIRLPSALGLLLFIFLLGTSLVRLPVLYKLSLKSSTVVCYCFLLHIRVVI
jgi:hypothetical protein